MRIRNRAIRIISRVILCVLCATGIYQNVWGSQTEQPLMMFAYFTDLSNLLVLIAFLWFIFADISAGKRYREPMQLKGAVTMSIILTFIIFNVVLRQTSPGIGQMPGNIFIHVITPIYVFIDYLLFSPKGCFNRHSPWLWAIIPFVYLVFIYIRAGIGGSFMSGGAAVASQYPYPFLDVAANGLATTVLTLVVMTVGFLLLSYLLVGLDHLLKKISIKARGSQHRS